MSSNASQPSSPHPESLDFPLVWDDSFAIALALRKLHQDVRLEDVSLSMIYHWTIALPNFHDDRELANEAILSSIYQEWYEEVNSL